MSAQTIIYDKCAGNIVLNLEKWKDFQLRPKVRPESQSRVITIHYSSEKFSQML